MITDADEKSLLEHLQGHVHPDAVHSAAQRAMMRDMTGGYIDDHIFRETLRAAAKAMSAHRIASTEALTAENDRLKAECATLAAGSCDVPGGKIGDERGHFYCTLTARVAELEQLCGMAIFRMELIAQRLPEDEDGKGVKAHSFELIEKTRQALGTQNDEE